MIEFVVDTDSCAQLASEYLDNMTHSTKKITMSEYLDNMTLMTLVGYNPDEISELVDRLENMPLGRLMELYPPAAADEESDCNGDCNGDCGGDSCQDPEYYEDEPDPVADETFEEIIAVVVNNDERVELLEEELERYRKDLADVRSEVKNLQQVITDAATVATQAAGTGAAYRFEYNID